MKTQFNQETTETKPKLWKKSGENLVRYLPSGTYFARFRVKGYLHRESLGTDDKEEAKENLEALKRRMRNSPSRNMTMGDAVELFEVELDNRTNIVDASKHTRRKNLASLLRTWPGLKKRRVRDITEADCVAWANKFRGHGKVNGGPVSATFFNATLDTLRLLFHTAKVSEDDDPSKEIKYEKVKDKPLRLPTLQQFEAFVQEMQRGGGWCSPHCADMVRFMAYSGMRVSEAGAVLWSDCDFVRGEITVRITKGGVQRVIPMIAEMKTLLARLRAECPQAEDSDPVLLVRECQEAMDRAAKVVGISRPTHHTWRHWFASRALQCGVDIPTVAHWLGHKDKGVLLLKTYNRLTNEHSINMAAKVSFAVAPIAKPAQTTAQVVV